MFMGREAAPAAGTGLGSLQSAIVDVLGASPEPMTTRQLIAAVFPPDDMPPRFVANDRVHKALRGLLERQLVTRTAQGRGHVYTRASAERAPVPPLARGSRGVDALLALWFGPRR